MIILYTKLIVFKHGVNCDNDEILMEYNNTRVLITKNNTSYQEESPQPAIYTKVGMWFVTEFFWESKPTKKTLGKFWKFLGAVFNQDAVTNQQYTLYIHW